MNFTGSVILSAAKNLTGQHASPVLLVVPIPLLDLFPPILIARYNQDRSQNKPHLLPATMVHQ